MDQHRDKDPQEQPETTHTEPDPHYMKVEQENTEADRENDPQQQEQPEVDKEHRAVQENA